MVHNDLGIPLLQGFSPCYSATIPFIFFPSPFLLPLSSLSAQMDVNVGSTAVARNVIGLVISYVKALVVDLAILIEVSVSR